MIVFWLVYVLSSSPGVVFGVVAQFTTKAECYEAMEKAPPERREATGCLQVLNPVMKET